MFPRHVQISKTRIILYSNNNNNTRAGGITTTIKKSLLKQIFLTHETLTVLSHYAWFYNMYSWNATAILHIWFLYKFEYRQCFYQGKSSALFCMMTKDPKIVYVCVTCRERPITPLKLISGLHCSCSVWLNLNTNIL